MKVLFLGTGAADWGEADRGKPYYRAKSSVLIDGRLLIDAGPDIFEPFGGLLPGVEFILQTHAHDDHLSRNSLIRLCEERGRIIHGDGAVLETAGSVPGLKKMPLEPYKSVNIGGDADGINVLPLEANHPAEPGERPFHYIVEIGGKRMFYGCDGAWLLYAAWSRLRGAGLDLAVLDGTMGDMGGNYRSFEHNGIPMIRLLAEIFRENGVIKPGGRLMVSHLAKNLHAGAEETKRLLGEINIETAYDGIKLTL